MSNEFTIFVDSRERKPLPFPAHLPMGGPGGSSKTVRLHTAKKRLDTSDYLLADGEGVIYQTARSIAIERKHSIDELAKNTLDPHGSTLFRACLSRLAAFPVRILLLEGHPERIFQPTPRTPQPWVVRDLFMRLCLEYGLHIHFIPSTTAAHRRAVGEWVAAMLINGGIVYDSTQGKL